MNRSIIALALINLGVFIGAVALLPHASGYSYTGPITRIVNSREHWEVAWLITLSSALVTSGAVVLFSRTRGR